MQNTDFKAYTAEDVQHLKKQKDEVAKAALDHWGPMAQISKAAEELSELSAELSRITTNLIVRGGVLSEELGFDFYDELADVKLMLASIEQAESFSKGAYYSSLGRKIELLRRRLKK